MTWRAFITEIFVGRISLHVKVSAMFALPKTTTMKKQKLVSISKYLIMLRSRGIKLTRQALYQRRERNVLEFVIGGNTPQFKIDINKYPPAQWKEEKRGPKKAT